MQILGGENERKKQINLHMSEKSSKFAPKFVCYDDRYFWKCNEGGYLARGEAYIAVYDRERHTRAAVTRVTQSVGPA